LLIDLCSTFIRYFNRIPSIIAALVPAVLVALVYLAVFTCVEVALVGTADHSLFAGAGLVANERALFAAGRLGTE
jgi:hypothetical protein